MPRFRMPLCIIVSCKNKEHLNQLSTELVQCQAVDRNMPENVVAYASYFPRVLLKNYSISKKALR